MFIEKKSLSFNIDSIPEVLRKCWEYEHGGNYMSLKNTQKTALKVTKVYILGILLFGSISFICYTLLCSPTFLKNFHMKWGLIALYFLAVSALAIITSHYIPLRSVMMIDEFVCNYNALMDLLCHKWDYSAKYIDPCPGVTPDFSKVGEFVTKKLTDMATRIKELEKDANTDKLSDRHTECILLHKEFREAFDILIPFGMVYPTYEPYFDPDGSYFF